MSPASSWDVAVRFDNAPGNSFYPFSPSPGVVGTPYYAVLGSSDNLVKWIPYCYRGCGWQTCNWAIIGRKPCEQLSTSCESLDPLTSGCICFGGLKNAARMDGWFVERTRISDTKYHVKIVGQSVYRADPRGALWLNPDSGWKFTHLDSCYVQADQGSPPRPVSCALTSDTMLQFQAAGDCAGSCACEDAGSINIDVIAEKTATPPEPPTYSATLVGKYNPQDNRADAKAYLIWYQLNNLNSNMITRAFTHCNTDLLGFAGRCDGPVTKPDFSTEGGGLSNAVLHYHFSHGENGKINLGGDFLLPGEVSGKWNNKNKWVVIDACEVLSDRSWGNALGTSHGVLGFETVKPLDDQLAKYFVQNLNSGKTVYNSYFDATRSAYGGDRDIEGYPINYDIRAIAIFKNPTQRDQDSLSNIAPNAPSNTPVVYCWHVKTGEMC